MCVVHISCIYVYTYILCVRVCMCKHNGFLFQQNARTQLRILKTRDRERKREIEHVVYRRDLPLI